MTSSLVGSEMCIRDRSMTLKSIVVQIGDGHGIQMDMDNRKLHWSGSFDTVSYTHLTLPTICSV
eukprot:6873590-Prorocentrum_lima.AAC.1